MRTFRTRQIVLAGALALFIVPTTLGCGGGGGSLGIAAPAVPVSSRSIRVEGRALLNTVTRAVPNTPIEGDSPIPNAPAELALVLDNGQIGNVLAHAITDSNGVFSFSSVTVPSETSRFIIRVIHNGQTVSRFLPVAVSTTEPLRVDLSTTVATGYLLEQIIAAPALIANDLSSSMETYIAAFDTLRQNGTAANVDPTLAAIDQTAAIAQLKGLIEPAKPADPVPPTPPSEPAPVTPDPTKPTGNLEITTRGK